MVGDPKIKCGKFESYQECHIIDISKNTSIINSVFIEIFISFQRESKVYLLVSKSIHIPIYIHIRIYIVCINIKS